MRVALLCAAVLATLPWAEVGMNDDWSFTHTALDVARSGRLVYYYWSEPIIGFQAYWAALFIRIFGFSFTLVRLSTLPLAMGSAALLHGLARYAGLARGPAFLATLSVMLSPLVIPLSVSFMTEIPALFFLLAVVYCGLRALDHPDRRGCAWWLFAGTVAGFLGEHHPGDQLGPAAVDDSGNRVSAPTGTERGPHKCGDVGRTAGGGLRGLPVVSSPALHIGSQVRSSPDAPDGTLFPCVAHHRSEPFSLRCACLVGAFLSSPGDVAPQAASAFRGDIDWGALPVTPVSRPPGWRNIVTHWGFLHATTDIIGNKPRVLISVNAERGAGAAGYSGDCRSVPRFFWIACFRGGRQGRLASKKNAGSGWPRSLFLFAAAYLLPDHRSLRNRAV